MLQFYDVSIYDMKGSFFEDFDRGIFDCREVTPSNKTETLSLNSLLRNKAANHQNIF